MWVKYLHFFIRKTVWSDRSSCLHFPCSISLAYFLLHTGYQHLLWSQERNIYENHSWKEPEKCSYKLWRSQLPFNGQALNWFHLYLWSSHSTFNSRCTFCVTVAKTGVPEAMRILLKEMYPQSLVKGTFRWWFNYFRLIVFKIIM